MTSRPAATPRPAASSGKNSRGSVERLRAALVVGGVVMVVLMIVVGALASKRRKALDAANSEAATSTAAPSASASAIPSSRPARATASAAPGRPVAAVVIDRVVHPVVPPTLAAGQKTNERLAVDALHAGDFHRAHVLYKELAAACPQNPAFASAERLLSTKVP